MSLFTRLSLLLLFALSVPAAAQNLPLPLETMPNKTFADVQAQAKTEATSGPVWGNAPDPSTLPVHVTLSGTVTADATMTKLAIFSDDGCDVYVDGALVWSSKDKPQALPDLANSLHELPVTLSPRTHSVEIDYSNTIYTVADASKGIPPDIDGCTLFMYGPSLVPVVTVTTGSWQPDPAAVGQTITSAVSASVSPAYQSPSGDSISQNWTWTTGGVYQSADGTSGSFMPDNGDYAIDWTQGSSSTTFSGIFNDGGYYIIEVTATLTYHDDTTNTDVGTYSGTGYIGGSASDLASSGSASSGNAVSAHSAIHPRAAGTAGGTGVPVVTVAKLQYAFGTSGAFQDIPNPLVVDAGTTVVFKAIPTIAGAAFPAGQPVWSGAKGTASGDTDSVIFATLASGTQTVTATVGSSSVSANIMVQGVSITVGALANGSGQTPLLRGVGINGDSTYNGTGTTLTLTVAPVNNFAGKVTLDVDANNDATPDAFGNQGAGQDSTASSIHYSFYNPSSRDGGNYLDAPSYFTLDFSQDARPKSIILTLTLDANGAMLPGNYKAIVFANPNDQGNSRMGDELVLPFVVQRQDMAESGSFSGGAHDGLYKAARTYYTGQTNTGTTKTGSYYDALSGQITLPPTSPDSVSLVQDYQTGDAFDIYSGGVARNPSTGASAGIDVGLTVGHTGNFGYSPTGNYESDGGSKTSGKQPDNNKTDQIQPGTITVVFEAPGYTDNQQPGSNNPIVVGAKEACLVVRGGTISSNQDGSQPSSKDMTYNFSNLPGLWVAANDISVKFITSIAQSPGTPYNGPPAAGNNLPAFFYTSGSKVPYVAWSNLSVHVQNSPSALTPITLPADEASPGVPYVSSSILNTVP